MAKLVYITGGQRSGKSLFAERMAERLQAHSNCPQIAYIATATASDQEFEQRIRIHKQRRGVIWTTIEEPIYIGAIQLSKEQVALLDCLTLWASNILYKFGIERSYDALDDMRLQIDALLSNNSDATILIVSSEIGLGGIAPDLLQRKYTDLLGSLNQYVASIADEAYMLLSGIPLRLK